MLEEIQKYAECDIDIINGYYWNQGFNNKINEFAELLYDLRKIDGLNKFGKNMLSCLYGKTLQSAAKYKVVTVPKNKISDYIAENGNYIYELIKKPHCYVVKLMQSFNMNFNLPQFGVQVLSESRRRMNAIVDFCNNSN